MKPHPITRCLSLLFFSSIAAHAGTHTWNGLGSTTNWSTAANWTPAVAPTSVDASPVVLVFPSGGFKSTNVCNITNLRVDSIVINGSGYALHTPFPVALPITLRGNGNSLYSAGTNNSITCPLVLDSANLNFGTSTSGQLQISGAMSGTGGFNKIGPGDVFLIGNLDNTYTGKTTVLGGTLHLAKTGGSIAVGGELVIGDLNGSSGPSSGVDSTVILDGP
jgi:autotransporter-associated beta strand protein